MSGEISIGELVGGISLNDTFSGPIKNVAEGLGFVDKSFEAVAGFAGVAAGAIAATTGAIVALGSRGADIVDVQDGFAQLSAEAKSSADVMLGALQRGTLDTISNFELMTLGNKALAGGLLKSAEDMETLAAGAKLLSGRVGGDTVKAFDTLTESINSGKTTALKQLGVFVDSERAAEAYARTLGKSASDLSAHEKATAVSQATLAALRGELAAAGPASADFADKIAQGKVAVSNLVDSLSVAIATSPALAVGMDAITKGIQSAFGSSQQDIVRTLTGYVNEFGIFLVQVVQAGVSGAQFLSNAWSGLKVIFNEFMALFVGQAGLVIQAVQAIVTAIQPVQDLAKSMGFARDGIDAAFDGIKRGVAEAGQTVEAMRQSFKDQSQEALDNAAKQNAAFESVKTTLAGVEGEMRKAADAQTESGQASEVAANGIKRVGEEYGKSAAEIKKLEEAAILADEALSTANEQIATKFADLQDRLVLANKTGLDRRLFEMELAKQRELEDLATLTAKYSEAYGPMAELVEESYRRQAAAALTSFAEQAQSAVDAGLTQREQLELTLQKAIETYDELLKTGKATEEDLRKAHEAKVNAERNLDEEVKREKLEQLNTIASAASSILRSIFGKNKAAAIAAAIIDTAAAIVKTLASLPFPFSLIPAAAVAAAGYAQIQQIRNTEPEGFAAGTPDMAFMDFGSATTVPLHGDEAVVNRAQGATLAEMVVDAVNLREDRVVQQLERMEEAQRERDRALPLLWRDMGLFARA